MKKVTLTNSTIHVEPNNTTQAGFRSSDLNFLKVIPFTIDVDCCTCITIVYGNHQKNVEEKHIQLYVAIHTLIYH